MSKYSQIPITEIARAYRVSLDQGDMRLGWNASLPKLRRTDPDKGQQRRTAHQPKLKKSS